MEKNYLESQSQSRGKLDNVLNDLADVQYALDRSSIVAITNQRGIILHANDKFCEISKYNLDELLGQDHRILNSGYHSKEFFKDMWATIGSGNIWRGEVCNRAKDGSLYWVDTTIVPFLNENGKPYQYVSIRNDISLRKQMEEEIRKSAETYRLITENSTDMISTIDGEGKLLYISPSYMNFLGYDAVEMAESNLLEWIHQEDREDVSDSIHNHFVTGKASSQLEFRLLKKNGEEMFVEAAFSPIIDEHKRVNNLVLVMRDITERKKTEHTIYHLAYHDTLTELPNRRFFMEYVRKEVYRAKRNQSQLAVMFLDVDHFKNVNDSCGHEVGDLVLTEAAKRIRACLRSNDIVARIGGDEFTVLLTNVKSMTEVQGVAQRIKESFQESISSGDKTHELSCSIGISLFPTDGVDVDELLKRADTALYVVKERGRNGYLFFDLAMEERSLERIVLENELRKAIQQEQFYIDYQPKKNLSTGELVGMEALVRWNHPELGKIPPNKFIPIAEQTGLILPLGEWVLKQGCMQNKAWQEQGLTPLKVSINLSPRQFYQFNLVGKIKEILDETGLDPKWLELEVTETVFGDLDNAVAVLHSIRDLGVHISIDDFGTGYSSLSYIKQLPIDTLKIDASFIRDIHQNKESQAIVQAIVSIARSLNLNVIAEGIENEEQMAALTEDGCIQGQGFLFSKPLSKGEFETYLGENMAGSKIKS
ncbi:EAL domain-containing protein [bacterium LRH843]|nr:EAL domain-containing protein [bacterium LRH843]